MTNNLLKCTVTVIQVLSKDTSSLRWCPIITSSVVFIDIEDRSAESALLLTDQRSTSTSLCKLLGGFMFDCLWPPVGETRINMRVRMPFFPVSPVSCRLLLNASFSWCLTPKRLIHINIFCLSPSRTRYILNIAIRHCFRLDLLSTGSSSVQFVTLVRPRQFSLLSSFPTMMMYGKSLRRCLVRSQNPCVRWASPFWIRGALSLVLYLIIFRRHVSYSIKGAFIF